MDYGKFLYERDKRAKESKSQEQEIKDVKVRPNIGDNDLETKVGMARRFLKKGALVRFTVMFRRREMRRPENGYILLERAAEMLDDVAAVERTAPETLTHRDLTMTFRPA